MNGSINAIFSIWISGENIPLYPLSIVRQNYCLEIGKSHHLAQQAYHVA